MTASRCSDGDFTIIFKRDEKLLSNWTNGWMIAAAIHPKKTNNPLIQQPISLCLTPS